MEHAKESTAATFALYQGSATGHFRYLLAQENLVAMHDLSRPALILDAAAGNGLNSEWLARRGHRVTLFDHDPEMLSQAKDRLTRAGQMARCDLVAGRIEESDHVFAPRHFDLVVCHHILEYVGDPLQTLKALYWVTAPGGELSLVTLNPVSEVVRAVVFQHDAKRALAKLSDHAYDAQWFGRATLFPLEQILAWCAECGWVLRDFRAVRVLADYIADTDYDEETRGDVFRLERELAGMEPYRRMGRYLQFCFKRNP